MFKEREGRYIRLVERALRPVLNGQSLPLILAATEGVAATFRTVNTYPHLAAKRSAGNPETSSDADIAAAARTILDEIYADEVQATEPLFDLRRCAGRATTDVSEVARWATYGAVDTLFVDIDESLSGSIDEASGEVDLGRRGRPRPTTESSMRSPAAPSWPADDPRGACRRGPGDGPTAAILRSHRWPEAPGWCWSARARDPRASASSAVRCPAHGAPTRSVRYPVKVAEATTGDAGPADGGRLRSRSRRRRRIGGRATLQSGAGGVVSNDDASSRRKPPMLAPAAGGGSPRSRTFR